MTDKEIIIDGIDVSKCNWCDFEPNAEPYCRINDGEDLSCEDNPNCNFKNLKRKEQECKNYKQALDEIEKIAINDCENCAECTTELNFKESCPIFEILDIISKTKEAKIKSFFLPNEHN